MTGQNTSEVEIRRDVKIPLRDGCQLNAILYLPLGQLSAAPVIFALTPYLCDRLHDRGLYFAARALPFIAVDVRGRGNSEGTFHPHIHDADDGYDVVQWLASQTFCNGKVAMYGGSYLGYVQWVIASRRPAALSTIIPTASPFLGVDVPIRNNVFSLFSAVRWLTAVSGRVLEQKLLADSQYWSSFFRRRYESGEPLRAADSATGRLSPVFLEWMGHPEQSGYWDAQNPTKTDYAGLNLPVLTITAAYDGDQPGALEHYKRHVQSATQTAREGHYLVIGPWDHSGCGTPQLEFEGIKIGPAGVIDMSKLHLDWYRWIFGIGAKPELLKNRVTYYVTGVERWRYASSLEEVTSRCLPLYLHSDANPTDVFRSGTLIGESPGCGVPDHYVYDPRNVSRAKLESTLDDGKSLTDQTMIHALFGQSFVYHSLPFEEDIEVSGFFKFSAWISIDRPDTDFRVSLYEIGLDGSSIFLTADWIRARYRRSLREATFIQSTEPLPYDFERFPFISRLIRKGHRLRMVFDSKDSIYEQRNYNSGGTVADESMQDAAPVTIRLFHDWNHPSVLYVPIGRGDSSEADDESPTLAEFEKGTAH